MVSKKTNTGNKTKLISLYVRVELYLKLQRMSEQEDLPLSRTIARLLNKAVEQQ